MKKLVLLIIIILSVSGCIVERSVYGKAKDCVLEKYPTTISFDKCEWDMQCCPCVKKYLTVDTIYLRKLPTLMKKGKLKD